MIEAVLFDFGGVFTDSPFEALRSLAGELDLDVEEALGIVFGSYDRDTDHPWHRVERGELPLEEARQAILASSAEWGRELDLFAVLERMAGGGIRADAVGQVREIRSSGRRTALVTNNAAEFRDLWRPLLPLEELFDAVVDSSEVGIRKPDPRIFQLTLDRIGGVAPQRTAFLDDHEGNVAAARSLGMHGVLVAPDHRPAFEELTSLLE